MKQQTILFIILMMQLAAMPTVFLSDELTDIEVRLEQVRIKKLGEYPVRSRYLKDDGKPQYTNRLVDEDSPYLLQHAHNPVNWYPWSDEAFATARRENKAIFLSIGYATCHWCHVMELESFDNEAVAKYLNEHFISIKVDREQRPDLDQIYITGAMLLSGEGGWPLTGFLTPSGKPFFIASYFPRDEFMNILTQVAQKWMSQQAEIEVMAEGIYQSILEEGQFTKSAQSVSLQGIDSVNKRMLDYEDKKYGGINELPKFPMESKLQLLQNQLLKTGNIHQSPSWQFLKHALNGMLKGGIYDQLAGGFHRYATDSAWLVPHFEKTLYNQAQLAQIYFLAWQLSGDKEYLRISKETIDYTLTEMRAANGCFYSALDADSGSEEGKYYLWTRKQVEQLFNKNDANFINKIYAVSQEGNFKGQNILHLEKTLNQIAKEKQVDYNSLINKLNILKFAMHQQRVKRISPLQDIKQITQWNGMMIVTLTNAGLLMGQQQYIDAAIKCADNIWQNGRDNNGYLYRSIIAGQTSGDATLGDYANYLQALISLYDVTADKSWLDKALILHKTMSLLFEDPIKGGFFNTIENPRGPLPIRNKFSQDNDMASGNSATLLALIKLDQRSDDSSFNKQINNSISYFANALNQKPMTLPLMLDAVSQFRNPMSWPVTYAAKGKIRITTSYQQAEKKLNIHIQIAEGWHINSHNPLDKKLIATDISNITEHLSMLMTYPEGELKYLGFSRRQLSLYENSVQISGQISAKEIPHYMLFNLRLQACSDTLCLLPETIPITAIQQ